MEVRTLTEIELTHEDVKQAISEWINRQSTGGICVSEEDIFLIAHGGFAVGTDTMHGVFGMIVCPPPDAGKEG